VYTEAVEAVTEGQLETAMAKVDMMTNLNHRKVMKEHPREMQYPVAAVNAGRLTYGRRTSQLIESLNNNILIARNLDPFSALIWLLMTEEERFFQNQKLARETPLDGLIPHVKKKLDNLAEKQAGLHAKELTTGRYRVHSGGQSYVVELPRLTGDDNDAFGSCTCGLPLLKHFPCKHMYTAIIGAGMDPVAIVPHFYDVETWQKVYPADATYPVINLDSLFVEANRNPLMRPPTCGAPKKGRPAASRIRGFLEHAAVKAAASIYLILCMYDLILVVGRLVYRVGWLIGWLAG
jgi:hypothetical protein